PYAHRPVRLASTADDRYRNSSDASRTAGWRLFPWRPDQTSECKSDGIVPASRWRQQWHRFLHRMARCLSGGFLYRRQRPAHRFRYQNGWYRQWHRPPPAAVTPGTPAWRRGEYGRRSYGYPTVPPWRTGRGR